MNSLSWLIYIAGLVGNLGVFLNLCVIALVVGFAIGWLAYGISEGETGKPPKSMIIWASIIGLISCFIPSQNTVYAIATSQVGEHIAKNPQVQELGDDAAKALKSWIKKQIDGEPPKPK